MSNETTVEQVNIDIDALFGAEANSVMLPETNTKSVFKAPEEDVDMSFAENKTKDAAVNETETVEETVEEITEETKKEVTNTEIESEAQKVFDSLDEAEEEEEGLVQKKETRGRKKIEGISGVFQKLIKEDKIVPFDDDKSLDDYSSKDWEELIEANLEERASQVRRETPKQFFEALPTELKVAAQYVADGGTDLKGLFKTLAYVEESRELNPENSKDQEKIIYDYLQATGYGTQEEIADEIEIWKDLGKLEQQAMKFKPKLDKMQETVVARKLEEQQMRQQQQEQASKQYMHNVYETLKEGKIKDLKLDKKTQSMIYNGLVQPAYPSVSGKNTNLLGHLLEKYQFVEPNYNLISEVLWLMADEKGYKAKIMEKGAQKSIEKTVRKLKTEQANSGGSSLGVQEAEKTKTNNRRKIARPKNIFEGL
jgi:hypothetical protein